uniref:DsrE/DsrF-like family protein n=1 Tax=Chlorobium chlorochromatii (strain CaD3) TaxID=340177 RepID=Q3ARG4_CHLCH
MLRKKLPLLLCAAALLSPMNSLYAGKPTAQAKSSVADGAAAASSNQASMSAIVPVADHTKGIYLVLTEADAMTQMMALVLATQHLEQGKTVQVLLCGPAAKLAVKNCKEEPTIFKPINKSPQMLLAVLLSRGVQVEVCPLFLPNSNMTQEQLIAGVTVAKPPVVASQMRADGIKTMNF